MSRKANPTAVGGFVLGAIALAVAIIFLFGGDKFFRTTETYVAFFEGSLKGLEIGAPVTFRGVRIGTVKGLQVVYDVKDNDLRIPVIFEIDMDRLEVLGGDPRGDEGDAKSDEGGNVLVKRGLRAQLQMRSMVTGQLAVNLDFFPGTKIVTHDRYRHLPEYPTVPSDVEKFRDVAAKMVDRLQNVPIDEISTELLDLLKSMKALVNSPELEDAVKGADRLVNSPDIQASLKSLRAALESADGAMQSVRRLADNADGQLVSLAQALHRTSQDLDKLLDEATRVFESVESSLSDDSDLRVRTIAALEEVAQAARSIRVLTDYLERHPEAILKGKKEEGQ